jgi:tripartite-type tricarboxylate transporter receptor subunit TctC
MLGQYLSEYFGQQFVVENRVGAGGNIGMEVVLSSPPDGYTIGFVAPNNAINITLYEHLPFDFLRDSTPVAGTMKLANVMDVNLSFPAKNLAEFIAMAKANPGKINFEALRRTCRASFCRQWPASSSRTCPIAVRRPR